MKIVTRQEAKAAGLKRYFTGAPCKNGHTSERYTRDSKCVECAFARVRKRRAKNPEHNRELARRWAKANPAKIREMDAAQYAKGADRIRARARAYYQANKQTYIEQARAYNKEHPEIKAALDASYRARKRDAVCACCTNTDFREVYDLAKLAGMEVDHITPLALGGAHCRSNLQLLTFEDHKDKTAEDLRRIAAARREARESDG